EGTGTTHFEGFIGERAYIVVFFDKAEAAWRGHSLNGFKPWRAVVTDDSEFALRGNEFQPRELFNNAPQESLSSNLTISEYIQSGFFLVPHCDFNGVLNCFFHVRRTGIARTEYASCSKKP